jgi:hypothetical protein
MRTLGIAIGIFSVATVLSAATIDVSYQTTQLLQTGDSLSFLFTDSSYATYATGLGLAPYPNSINYTFASSPLSAAGHFTAELQSLNGAVDAIFPGPIHWTSGYAQTSGYSGPISTLVDSLTLSGALSQALFSNAEAELILTYSGPDATVGMPGSTLRHDLDVSLLGSFLSIGGIVYSASLDNGSGGANTPEPSSALLVAAGTAFCLLAVLLKRYDRPRA